MKVLIADDDIDCLRLLEKTLNKWAYNIIAVSDGIQALNALKSKNAPILAILDWNMPEMDGLEVVRHIRSDRKQNYIYIILLTAKTRKEDMLRGLDAGADDYIKKPFDREELHARLRAGERIVQLNNI